MMEYIGQTIKGLHIEYGLFLLAKNQRTNFLTRCFGGMYAPCFVFTVPNTEIQSFHVYAGDTPIQSMLSDGRAQLALEHGIKLVIDEQGGLSLLTFDEDTIAHDHAELISSFLSSCGELPSNELIGLLLQGAVFKEMLAPCSDFLTQVVAGMVGIILDRCGAKGADIEGKRESEMKRIERYADKLCLSVDDCLGEILDDNEKEEVASAEMLRGIRKKLDKYKREDTPVGDDEFFNP